MQESILTIDAAAELHRNHSKLLRNLDQVRSLLPAELADAFIEPVALMRWEGKEHRAYRLSMTVITFLFMGRSPKHEILWIADKLR